MTPYYQDDAVTIYHGDAREIAPTLPRDVAVVSDPPYGMNWDGRITGGRNGTNPGGVSSFYGQRVPGDDEPFDPSPWLDYPEVILWGSNHYGQRLPVGTTLVWVKRNDESFGSFLSDAEVAWEKGGHGVYCYRDTGYKAEPRYHPTQKPIAVMRWCVARTRADTILDPFMGSGTTLRAAKDLGRRAIGIELSEKWCEIAANRCRQEVLGLGGAA